MIMPLCISVLAAFDAWDAGQWAFNLLVTVTLGYIASKNREIAKLRDEVKASTQAMIAQQITTVRTDQEANIKLVEERFNAAAKLVEERMRAASHEVMNHSQALIGTVDELRRRLDCGDAEFRSLSQRDREVEVGLLREMSSLREVVATKDDLRQVREEIRRAS